MQKDVIVSSEPAAATVATTGQGVGIDLLKYALRARFETQRADVDAAAWAALGAPDIYNLARLNKLVLLLSGPVLNSLPSDIRSPLGVLIKRYKARTVAMNAHMIVQTLSVAAAFEKAGIAFVVMKGVSQQKLLYGEYFARPVGDVDLLVASGDYRRAQALLKADGFVVDDDCRSMWWRIFLGEQHMVKMQDPPVTVDLHYRLQQPGSPSPRDPSAFIRKREVMDVAGAEVPVVSRTHLPILSAISIAKALFNREACGSYVLDFQASVRLMTADERLAFMAEAERQGMTKSIQLGFRAAELLFGERLSDAANSGVLEGTCDEDLTAMILAPWTEDIRWPQRRDVLRELCGSDITRYAGEASWAGAADLVRRWHEHRVPHKPRLPAEAGQVLPGVGA